MYVAPNSVSGRVVKMRSLPFTPSSAKSTSAPIERPIQFFCISYVLAGHSTRSRSSSKRSAYSVILSTHCRMGLRMTS